MPRHFREHDPVYVWCKVDLRISRRDEGRLEKCILLQMQVRFISFM